MGFQKKSIYFWGALNIGVSLKMKEIKRLVLRIFFSCEIILFIFFYFFGAEGFQALMHLKSQKNNLVNGLSVLQQDVNKLQYELSQWKSDLFLSEKIAREQLQMSKPDEEIYLIN